MIGNAEFAGDEDASKSEWSRWWSRINLSEQLSLKRLSLSSTEDWRWTVERVMSLDLFEIPSKPKHYQLKTPSSALYFKGWICCHSSVNNPAKLPAPHIALAVALPHHFSADCSSCLTKKISRIVAILRWGDAPPTFDVRIHWTKCQMAAIMRWGSAKQFGP